MDVFMPSTGRDFDWLMAQQETSNSRGWIGGIATVLVCVALFFAIRTMTHGKVVVRVASAEFGDIRSVVQTNGKVDSVSDFQAVAAVPGTVSKLYVDVGQKVSVGQALLRMDDTDERSRVAAAQASLAAANATLQNMQAGGSTDERTGLENDLKAAQLQRQEAVSSVAALQGLQAKGAASANEVAAAQQKVQDADVRIAELQARKTGRYGAADIATQRAQVAQAQVGLQAAQGSLGSVDIKSPIAGTVYSVPVQEHDWLSTGGVLLNVADLNRLRVIAYFDEPEIGKLAIGQPVEIVWAARPGLTWHGRILQAPATIMEYGTRNVGQAVISVDDAKGDLLPNTNVTVTVTTREKQHVLTVPREALHTDGESNYVFKVVSGHLQKVSVGVDMVTLTKVEITSGLSAGDVVALAATTEAELTDGLEVKAQP